MDALAILKHIASRKNKVEKLESGSKPIDTSPLNSGIIISVMIGAYAAYLSYECNSKRNMPQMTKIVFAVLAYIFGLFYLIYYYLFQYDKCEGFEN